MSSPSLVYWPAWRDLQWSGQEGDTSRLMRIREAGLVREVCPTFAQLTNIWRFVYEDIVMWRARVVFDDPQCTAVLPVGGDISACFRDILMVLEAEPEGLADRYTKFATRPNTSPFGSQGHHRVVAWVTRMAVDLSS